MDYAVFDAAVNLAPGRGAKWLKAAVGAAQDGAVDDKNLGKVDGQDAFQVIDALCDRRLHFFAESFQLVRIW